MITAMGFMSGNDLGKFGLVELLVLLLEFLRMEGGQRGGITIWNSLIVVNQKRLRTEEEITHYHVVPVPSLRGKRYEGLLSLVCARGERRFERRGRESTVVSC